MVTACGRTTRRRSTELVVVDNDAEDQLRAVVAAAWPGATVIANSVNRGFAAAVNQGLAAARGRAILLLNPDAELAPDALERLLTALEQLPAAGIVAPRLLDPAGRPVLSCYTFLSLATVAWRHFQLYRLLPNVVLGRYRRPALADDAVAPFPVDWAQGACLLIRREVFEQIGPLDERFFLYCEEVDLCRRAAAAGWRTYFVPTARVRHAEGSSSVQVVPLKLASHYFSLLLYFDKHLGPTQTALLRGVLLLDLALRMVYRLLGLALGRPPDARQRLASYRAIAGALLTATVDQVAARWRAMGAQVDRPPVALAGSIRTPAACRGRPARGAGRAGPGRSGRRC